MYRPLICVFILGLAAAQPASAQELAVDELVRYVRPANGAVTITIPVRNEAWLPADVVIELGEWEVDATGAHRFHPSGTLGDGCGERLVLELGALRIDAGGEDTVRLTYRGSAADRCRAMVWLRADDGELPLDGEEVRLIVRTGVKLYVEP
jgi:hypothetical protein